MSVPSFRMEGLTITVENVARSITFYENVGFKCEWNAAPAFAMMRLGDSAGATVGLLSREEALKEGVTITTAAQNRGVHIELSTDDLDGLYEHLKTKGIHFISPPHDEPWERSATAVDPDGYAIEIAQGRRGKK